MVASSRTLSQCESETCQDEKWISGIQKPNCQTHTMSDFTISKVMSKCVTQKNMINKTSQLMLENQLVRVDIRCQHGHHLKVSNLVVDVNDPNPLPAVPTGLLEKMMHQGFQSTMVAIGVSLGISPWASGHLILRTEADPKW